MEKYIQSCQEHLVDYNSDECLLLQGYNGEEGNLTQKEKLDEKNHLFSEKSGSYFLCAYNTSKEDRFRHWYQSICSSKVL